MRSPPDEAVERPATTTCHSRVRGNDRVGDAARRTAKNDPERRCVITGAHGSRDALIRLAIDGEGRVFPDLAARAPGRGAWLSPDRALIASAAARGKLRGALMRAFRTTAIAVPDDLPEQIASGLERRALDRLGLENKAGHLIWGAERIADALAAGRVRLLLHATDAAADGAAKLDARARAAGVPILIVPATRERMSLALGRDNVVHAAVCDDGAATRTAAALYRWRAFIGSGSGADAPFNGLISVTPEAKSAAGTRVSGHE
ncbi:MAG: DUF448 domain-containing protein [Sphingomonadaceae bacterium]|nr:DUF448 domain-containing protein [Sphingomonadaceae bacterium]